MLALAGLYRLPRPVATLSEPIAWLEFTTPFSLSKCQQHSPLPCLYSIPKEQKASRSKGMNHEGKVSGTVTGNEGDTFDHMMFTYV